MIRSGCRSTLAFVSQGRAVQTPLNNLWMGRLRSRDREGYTGQQGFKLSAVWEAQDPFEDLRKHRQVAHSQGIWVGRKGSRT